MTLRELLKACDRDKTVSLLQKEYYKDKEEDFTLILEAYDNVWEALTLKPQRNPIYDIVIVEKEGEFSEDDYIDVCLYNNDDEEMFAADLVAWGELIDCEVRVEISMENQMALAHILWELTFWSFTEEGMKMEEGKLKELVERIENGEEELIPFKELELDEDDTTNTTKP